MHPLYKPKTGRREGRRGRWMARNAGAAGRRTHAGDRGGATRGRPSPRATNDRTPAEAAQRAAAEGRDASSGTQDSQRPAEEGGRRAREGGASRNKRGRGAARKRTGQTEGDAAQAGGEAKRPSRGTPREDTATHRDATAAAHGRAGQGGSEGQARKFRKLNIYSIKCILCTCVLESWKFTAVLQTPQGKDSENRIRKTESRLGI